jgi:hypothetical protein
VATAWQHFLVKTRPPENIHIFYLAKVVHLLLFLCLISIKIDFSCDFEREKELSRSTNTYARQRIAQSGTAIWQPVASGKQEKK